MNYPYYGNYQFNQYPQYSQVNQSTYPNSVPNVQQNPDERIWVQGEGAAQAYLVAPNSFVRLWDSSQNVYYEKHADQSGRPYMETYEYKRRGSESPNADVINVGNKIDYAEIIKSLEARIDALERSLKNDEPEK